MRSFSLAVNVRRRGRSESSGLAAAGAGTPVGLRPSAVPAPAAAIVCAFGLGMTTRHSPAPSRVNFREAFVSASLAQRDPHDLTRGFRPYPCLLYTSPSPRDGLL